MNLCSVYLPLKRVIETHISIVIPKLRGLAKQSLRYKEELSLGNALQGLAMASVTLFLLSFGVGNWVAPANNKGEELLALRPALLANSSPPPRIAARSAYLLDLKNNFVLYDKNSSLKLPPASTVKIATALTALADYKLDEVVEVHPNCILKTGESVMGLQAWEKITVRNLLYGLLVASAGDAACALARHHQEGIMEFVAEMNHLARALKLEQTYFVDFTGLDSTLQYSTAKELTLLAEEVLKRQFFQEAVQMRELNISSVDGVRWHHLKTTNELLGEMPGISGVKTGYTAKAKGVFIFYFEREGVELLGTVMGSDDRFADARSLLTWVLSSFLFP